MPTKKWSEIRRRKVPDEAAEAALAESGRELREMMTATTATEPQARCIHCHVTVVAIGGKMVTRGNLPNWKHDYSTIPVGEPRPKCRFAHGPMGDDDVEGIEVDFSDGSKDGRWTEEAD